LEIENFIKISFKKHKLVQLNEESYLYKGFLSKDELAEVRKEIDKATPNKGGSIPLWYLDRFRPRVADLFVGDFAIDEMKKIDSYEAGKGMPLHNDRFNYEYDLIDMLVDENYTNSIQRSLGCYAFLIYLNDDYEGGEISYPEYNMDYKPVAGDMIIHNSEIIHGIKKVTSGIRYRFQGVVSQKFYFDAEKINKFKFPTNNSESYNPLDPDYSYTIEAPIIKSKRLLKFKETWVDTRLYK
jgi:2OG-Fe(II) oxygenase superfamily